MPQVVLPPLRWEASPNESQRLVHPVRLIVVHRPVGDYSGAIRAMCDPEHKAAAHVIVREDGAEATQLVPWARKAWACASFNSASDNIETPDLLWQGLLTEHERTIMRVCARVVAFRLHKRHLTPKYVHGADLLSGAGFTRHCDLGAAGGGHTDPTTDLGRWLTFGEMVSEEFHRGGFRHTWGR